MRWRLYSSLHRIVCVLVASRIFSYVFPGWIAKTVSRNASVFCPANRLEASATFRKHPSDVLLQKKWVCVSSPDVTFLTLNLWPAQDGSTSLSVVPDELWQLCKSNPRKTRNETKKKIQKKLSESEAFSSPLDPLMNGLGRKPKNKLLPLSSSLEGEHSGAGSLCHSHAQMLGQAKRIGGSGYPRISSRDPGSLCRDISTALLWNQNQTLSCCARIDSPLRPGWYSKIEAWAKAQKAVPGDTRYTRRTTPKQ